MHYVDVKILNTCIFWCISVYSISVYSISIYFIRYSRFFIDIMCYMDFFTYVLLCDTFKIRIFIVGETFHMA